MENSSVKTKQKNMRSFHVNFFSKQPRKATPFIMLLQYWRHLIQLVSAHVKGNLEMIRVLWNKNENGQTQRKKNLLHQ